MNRRSAILSWTAMLGLTATGAGIGVGLWHRRQRAAAGPAPLPQMPQAEFDAAFAPLTPPEAPLHLLHLGHSLVGPVIPAMLAQMVPGHRYAAQLGWGTTLKNHWLGPDEVPGYEAINLPAATDAKQALEAGGYDALVLTEMVELKDAIKWFSSSHYLAEWARLARQGRPDIRLYLYETWHRLDDPAGWLQRIDDDSATLWRDELLRRAMSDAAAGTIYRIPGGPAMAAVIRAAEAGQVPGLGKREALFARADDGSQDMIHLSDLGAYVIALTHYAVLYHQNPEGLPHRLRKPDGQMAEAFSDDGALAVQRIVRDVVRADPLTGLEG